MNDIILTRDIMDYLTIAHKAEVSASILGVQGNVVLLDQSVATGPDDWLLRVMQVTSGDAEDLQMVIVESNANQLILSEKFGLVVPQPGDTVRLWDGPLVSARIWPDEADTIKRAVDDGYKYFVTVCVLLGDYQPTSLGRRNRGVNTIESTFGVTTIVEVKNTTGIPDEASIFESYYAGPLLKEQVLVGLACFRADVRLHQMSGEPISTIKAIFQHPGAKFVTRGYKLEMDLRYK